MKLLNIIALFSALFIFSSCEDVIETDMPEGKKTIVVEGWLTNKAEPNYVKLYYTSTLTRSGAFSMISNAKVVLTDSEGNSETLKEVSSGKYEIALLKSVEGRTYTLKIESSAGNYEAKTEARRLSMPLDSITFKFEKKSAIYEKEGFYPRANGQELEGKGDFIQVKLFKNGQYLNQSADFNLFDDEFVDGNYIGEAELSITTPYAEGDLARAEVWSMTDEAWHFWVDIQAQLQNGQIFASPLSNTRTNVKKMSVNAADAIGYFGASLINSVEVKVRAK